MAAGGALLPDLRKPCILQRQARTRITLCEIEDEIEERRHGACSQRFDARHRDGGRSGMGGKGYSCAGAYETRRLASVHLLEQEVSEKDGPYLCANPISLPRPYTKSLLRASTTMNTTRSNGASPLVIESCTFISSHVARPGKTGLYGKKPKAKTRTAMGSKRFASVKLSLRRVRERAIAGAG